MIAQELEVSLHMAFMEARQARHEFITVEHLLLASVGQSDSGGGVACMRGQYRGSAPEPAQLHS